MVNMKRLIALFSTAALLVAFAGCVKTPDKEPAENTLTGENVQTTEQTQPSQGQTEQTNPAHTPAEPTADPAEPVVEPEDDDFVRVIDYIPQIRQSLAYATQDNFTGQVIYEFSDAYLRYGTVKKLAKAAQELEEQGLGLLIWDGYRPVYAQRKLFVICPDPTFVSPPGVGNQNHCRGRAVDLTLVDLTTGAELEMPTGFDDFTAYADRNYSDVSEEAAANARLLEDVMQRHGFEGYSAEWWHFNDTDEYPVEEEFDPADI